MKKILFFILLLVSQVFATLGDFELSQDGAKIIWNNNSQTTSIAASGSTTGSVAYIWPVADGSTSQTLITNGSGILNWADVNAIAGTHDILSLTHDDAVTDSPTRGSLIFSNSTPKWDELVISSALGATATHLLGGDGTDVGYRTTAQILTDLSGQAGAAFSWNSTWRCINSFQIFSSLMKTHLP